MKRIVSILSVVLLCLLVVSCQSTEKSSQNVAVVQCPATTTLTLKDVATISKYGNVGLDMSTADFLAQGFHYGSTVKVEFLGQSLVLPVVPNYSYVEQGTAAVVAAEGDKVQVAVNMGNFATTYGIAEKTTNPDKTYFWTAMDGVVAPIEFQVSMEDPEGYLTEYLVNNLQRTNDRADYSALTDAEYANARKVSEKLVRTSSPINPEINRDKEAMKAIEEYGVTVVMNLANDEATAKSYDSFEGSYYAGLKVIYLNLGVDFAASEFRSGLAEGLRFFAQNPGIYAVHCNEGKDRAGFVSALLEALAGFSYEEIVDDYMVTYYNYYGVERDSESYTAISSSNIIKTLSAAFGVENLKRANLEEEATEYCLSLGLEEAEVKALKANLK